MWWPPDLTHVDDFKNDCVERGKGDIIPYTVTGTLRYGWTTSRMNGEKATSYCNGYRYLEVRRTTRVNAYALKYGLRSNKRVCNTTSKQAMTMRCKPAFCLVSAGSLDPHAIRVVFKCLKRCRILHIAAITGLFGDVHPIPRAESSTMIEPLQ